MLLFIVISPIILSVFLFGDELWPPKVTEMKPLEADGGERSLMASFEERQFQTVTFEHGQASKK